MHVEGPAILTLISRCTPTDLTFEELVTVGRRYAGIAAETG